MDRTYEIVADALDRAGIRVLLGGGFAVNLHGFERGTKDIDLLIADSDRNRAHSAIEAAGMRSFREADVVTRYEPFPDSRMVLDVLPLDQKTFDMLWAGSVERMFQGRMTRIISLEHLLAMKLHAMKNDQLTRGFKDLFDIANLARINGWNADTKPLHDLCLKHGNAGILESIRKALAP